MLAHRVPYLDHQISYLVTSTIEVKDRAARLQRDMKAVIDKLKPLSGRELSIKEAKRVLRLQGEVERLEKGFKDLENEAGDQKVLPVLDVPELNADKTKRRLYDVSRQF